GDANVTHAREREAGSGADTVDGGEDRLLQLPDRGNVRVIRGTQRRTEIAGRTELVQVLSGAEAAPGAGQDDRTHLRVARLLQRLTQPVVHGAVESVQDIGPVQRDRLNRAVARDLDLGHAPDPTSSVPRGRRSLPRSPGRRGR